MSPRAFPAVVTALLLLHVTVAAQSPRVSTLRLTEIQRISGAEHDLSVVAMVTRGPDGTTWFSQPQDGNIVGFTRDGTRLGPIARKGEGPGSFREAPAGLWDDGRSLWAWDRQLRRITQFDREGQVVSTTPVTPPSSTSHRFFGFGAAGTTAWYWRYPLSAEGSRALVAASLAGASTRTLAEIPTTTCYVSSHSATGSRSAAIPFCHDERMTLSPNGRLVAVAQPMREDRGVTGVVVSVYSDQGTTLFSSTHRLERSPIPRASLDSAEQVFQRRAEGMRLSAEAWQAMANGGIPRTHPPIYQLAISDEGEVWVTTRSGPDGEHGLLVIRPDGTELGFTRVPRSSWVRWAGRGEVAIREDDADGLHDVVVYRVSRR